MGKNVSYNLGARVIEYDQTATLGTAIIAGDDVVLYQRASRRKQGNAAAAASPAII